MTAPTAALQSLTQALWAYERAAALARFLKLKAAYELEDERWLALAFRAYVVGYRMSNPDETCLEWARRVVSEFSRTSPAEHAQALAA